ncbi:MULTISPECIES: hypothetical protein [Streptomyces]|uniref:Uncharacterized protein n=1 Tax=Streptomyces gelaticus TaxID=285446 RepID=A0ABQ2WBA7_9ACTN|nr:hypothetical protein [Streptomyces gelaticus]GGV97554.1 hypothetical protein GCM10015535_69140 [Streptomyces gelaticus]
MGDSEPSGPTLACWETVPDQDDVAGPVAGPARPLLSVVQAREATAGLREAMDDVRRSVAVLAARVRDAHAAGCRSTAPLGVVLRHGVGAEERATAQKAGGWFSRFRT